MRVANLLILPLLLLGSGSALGQGEPPEFEVTYEYTGTEKTKGWVWQPFLGFFMYQEIERPVTGPVFITLFAPPNMPSHVISAEAKMKIKAKIKWVGPGSPPARTYCIINSNAAAQISGFTDGDVSASNGLGTVPVRSTGNMAVSETANGRAFRVVDLQEGVAYVSWELEMDAHAMSLPGQPGDVEVSGTGNLEIVDRSVQLDAAATPTVRRGPDGVAVLNQRDETGSLRGDVGVPLKLPPGIPPGSKDDDYLYGIYETTINRDLVGYWHREAIFNEWEMDIPHLRMSDGWLHEIEWLPVRIGFFGKAYPPEYGRPLDSLLSGTVVGTVKYTATDSVDNFTATANYYLHYHPEAEKTGEDWKPKWTGELNENEDVGDQFPAMTIAVYKNDTPSNQVSVQFVISEDYEYTFDTTWEVSVSAGFKKVANLQLGGSYTRKTSERWKVGTSHTLSFPVPSGRTVIMEVFPWGDVNYPVLAEYGPNGFKRDVSGHRPEHQVFGYKVKLAAAGSPGGGGSTGGPGG